MRRVLILALLVIMMGFAGRAFAEVVVADNGTYKGEAAVLDFGDGISVDRTGVVANITVTGSSNTPTITGGTINGATVGATTPAAGKFTTLSASGAMTMNSLIVVGSNQTVGTATLANGTKTVSTTAVTAASEIFLTRKAASGTLGNLNITSQNAGANFTIGSGTATENSTVNWLIVN